MVLLACLAGMGESLDLERPPATPVSKLPMAAILGLVLSSLVRWEAC